MASLKPSFQRFSRRLCWFAYVATVGVFLATCAQFYVPGKGFTYLIRFGAHQKVPPVIPALQEINHYEEEDSYGYDAQYYAQIAMQPWLSNRALKGAVDNLPYRARRILFPLTAYGLAFGDPARALHIYAVQNILCWFALAGLMLRWFPPESWGNFLRWFGVLFSFGLCVSVRGSLVDGPSLLLIAGGIALAETRRPWWAAVILGVAGLGKETNLLSAAALPLPGVSLASWWRAVVRGVVVVAPLALWMLILWSWLGASGDAGMRNFDWPFAAYVGKWRETMGQLNTEGIGSVAQWSLLALIAMTAQWLFFMLRWRWEDPWWRVGAAYALLMVVLGTAVWENYPGATARVLLPMTLAFNILVPRGRNLGWWLVLLAGNLTVFFSADFLKPPGRESFHLSGPRELIMIEKTGQTIEALFDDPSVATVNPTTAESHKEWGMPERSHFEYWRWSFGDATIVLRNPLPFAVTVDLTFGLKSNDERRVTVQAGGRVLWSGETGRSLREINLSGVRLEPGDTHWRLETDQPAKLPANGDPRALAFSVRNLLIKVRGRADLPPKP